MIATSERIAALTMDNKKQTFFWLHAKKCAGSSFRKSFTPPYVQTEGRETRPKPFIAVPKEEWNDVLNNFRIPLGEYDYKRMLFAKKFLYTDEEFNAMFKFVIVRNPYDRLVSSWKFLFGYRQTDVKRFLMKHSFRYFVSNLNYLLENKDQAHRRIAMHIAPIWSDITDLDGNLLVDQIFKLENINSDIEIIYEKIGTNIPSLSKANVNRKDNAYRKYYNKTTRKLMEKVYGDDIEKLGYSF